MQEKKNKFSLYNNLCKQRRREAFQKKYNILCIYLFKF